MGYGLVIGSNRLFAAADYLLEAIESRTSDRSLVTMYLDGPRPDKALARRTFTQTELIEAMKLLIRMGFVESISRPR